MSYAFNISCDDTRPVLAIGDIHVTCDVMFSLWSLCMFNKHLEQFRWISEQPLTETSAKKIVSHTRFAHSHDSHAIRNRLEVSVRTLVSPPPNKSPR